MQTLKTLQAAADAKISAAKREAEQLQLLAAAFPETLLIRHGIKVSDNKHGPQFHISAEVESRDDAATYLDALPLLPIAHAKGTFTTLKPESWMKDSELESIVIPAADLLPAYWHFTPGVMNPLWNTESEVRAFCEFNGIRVRVALTIKKDPASLLEWFEDLNGRRVVVGWELHNAPAGDFIQWSSGGKGPGETSVYFYREPGGAAPDVREMLSRTRMIHRRKAR